MEIESHMQVSMHAGLVLQLLMGQGAHLDSVLLLPLCKSPMTLQLAHLRI
jgi:hypothetical protein